MHERLSWPHSLGKPSASPLVSIEGIKSKNSFLDWGSEDPSEGRMFTI